MWKMKYSACRERGTKKNLSPRRELNPWPSKQRTGSLSTELREHAYWKLVEYLFEERFKN